MTRPRPASVFVFSMGLAACAPPPAVVTPVAAISPPIASGTSEPAAPSFDPTIVSVVTAPVPAAFALDGDVAEWGSLLPPVPPPPKDPPPKEAQKAPGPDPNPRDAASHVAIAVGKGGVTVAAELGEAAKAGLWLGIGSTAPDTAPIGDWQRGGGVREFNCDVNLANGEPNAPEARAACQALLDQHTAFVAAHEARFQRVLRLDAEGVRQVKDDGSLAPVDGAKVIWKPGPRGATAEATLPLTALPRVPEAPLGSLRFVARAVTTPKPPAVAPEAWVWLELPAPVGFEPWAELRATAFERARGAAVLYPSGLSYHPADPLHVETVGYDRGVYDTSHVRGFEATLYKKQASIGDVELGQVSAYGDWLAILRKEKLVELVDLPGNLQTVFERAGEIHVVTYSQYTSTDTWAEQARWSVMAIKSDGTVREDIMERGVDNLSWKQVERFSDKAMYTFGVRGLAMGTADEKEGTEVSWRWNPGSKTYALTRRRVVIRKKAKKKAP